MRDYIKIRTTIATDDRFNALPPLAQALYFRLLSSPTLTSCGVTDWNPTKASFMLGCTPREEVEAALRTLQENLFVVFDNRTGEVLIRGWLRNDKPLANSKQAKAVASAFRTTMSPSLKGVMVFEMRRLRAEFPDWQWGVMGDLLDLTGVNPRSLLDGPSEGASHGLSDGPLDSPSEGAWDGPSEGPSEGAYEGPSDRASEGAWDGPYQGGSKGLPGGSGNAILPTYLNEKTNILGTQSAVSIDGPSDRASEGPSPTKTKTKTKTKTEREKARANEKTEPEADAWERFWNAYPNHDNKLEAREEFTRALQRDEDRPTAQQLIDAASCVAESYDPGYVPAAGSWLRKGGWMNQPRRKARKRPATPSSRREESRDASRELYAQYVAEEAGEGEFHA